MPLAWVRHSLCKTGSRYLRAGFFFFAAPAVFTAGFFGVGFFFFGPVTALYACARFTHASSLSVSSCHASGTSTQCFIPPLPMGLSELVRDLSERGVRRPEVALVTHSAACAANVRASGTTVATRSPSPARVAALTASAERVWPGAPGRRRLAVAAATTNV